MKYYLFPILILLLHSCQQDSDSENQNDGLNADQAAQFPLFSKFPTSQFRELQLLNTEKETSDKIQRMEVVELSNAESAHFFFPTDSSEIILPTATILTEFKVFLRSSHHLEQENDLRDLFKSLSSKTVSHPIYSVYFFDLPSYSFRLSYYSQPSYIRLHFLLLTNHS